MTEQEMQAKIDKLETIIRETRDGLAKGPWLDSMPAHRGQIEAYEMVLRLMRVAGLTKAEA